MMRKLVAASVAAVTVLCLAVGASAHISTASGPAVANTSQEITLQVAHGCSVEGASTMTDTTSVKVDIPAGVTGVRAVSSADFPDIALVRDGSGNVTSITWSKVANGGFDADQNFYKLTFRAKVPDAAFTKIYFPAHQTCKAPGKPVDWVGLPGQDAGAEPAPEVLLLPAHTAGWNKFTVPAAVADLGVFKDAQIVWKDRAAYSSNVVIADQIKNEAGVTALTSLAAGDVIYVKY